MKIAALKESAKGEARVALTPESAAALQKLGHECLVEKGAGLAAGYDDAAYKAAGVAVLAKAGVLKAGEVLIRLRGPSAAEAALLRQGQIWISFLAPAENAPLLKTLAKKGVSALAMEMVPRISRAQKMDALSSMANIAGYRAVIEAGANFGRFFTGQVTAAGKVPPAKVLVLGAGVAGLAAIGTAVSLGAEVLAFDVRPEVAEQIESMGAKFVFLDFEEGADGAGSGGYAQPSSPEFLEKQRARFRELAPEVDIVITTALIPNRAAPQLWLDDMVKAMKPGSVIIDLAAERGGNCTATQAGEKIVTKNGVTVIGYTDFPSRMAAQASRLYASNVRHMIADLTPGKDGQIVVNTEDDVIRSALVTHEGAVTYPPPPLKVTAIAAQKPKAAAPVLTAEEKRAAEAAAFRRETRGQALLLALGGAAMVALGAYAPPSFMGHFIVFVLACFIGFQVIWKVSHALHTPLMAVTNAVSGIVVLGALLQIASPAPLILILAALAVLIGTINIVGGFWVTRRMLAMFQKS